MLSLELIDDLIEVPGEREHVGVFLLGELCVDSEPGVNRGQVHAMLLAVLFRRNGRV